MHYYVALAYETNNKYTVTVPGLPKHVQDTFTVHAGEDLNDTTKHVIAMLTDADPNDIYVIFTN